MAPHPVLEFRRSSRWKSTTHLPQILIVARILLLPMERPTACARWQIDLGNRTSPNRPNDVLARNGGSTESHRDADHPGEDNGDTQLNAETFISTRTASNQLVMQQLSAYFKSKDQRIAGLVQKLEASETRVHTQQLIRDYKERGRSDFRFDPDDMAVYLIESFVIPHILKADAQQYLEQMNWPSAKPRTLLEHSRY